MITVERFTDPNYSRPRYRLRYTERQSWLRDGFHCGSYKFKRDAELRADELNMGHFAAIAKRDGRYTYQPVGRRWVVHFLGIRLCDAPDLVRAYQLAGEHIADRRGVAADNPNRRP